MKALYILLAAGAFIGLCGFIVQKYGDARYSAGISFEQSRQAEIRDQENERTREIIEAVRRKTKNLSSDEINNRLRSLGVMRPDEGD